MRNDLHSPRTLIVPTLCVGMHPVTLCVTARSGTRSVPGGVPTREREERSLTAPRDLIVPTLCVGMHPVTLCVTFRLSLIHI